jgi:hypothetical protein
MNSSTKAHAEQHPQHELPDYNSDAGRKEWEARFFSWEEDTYWAESPSVTAQYLRGHWWTLHTLGFPLHACVYQHKPFDRAVLRDLHHRGGNLLVQEYLTRMASLQEWYEEPPAGVDEEDWNPADAPPTEYGGPDDLKPLHEAADRWKSEVRLHFGDEVTKVPAYHPGADHKAIGEAIERTSEVGWRPACYSKGTDDPVHEDDLFCSFGDSSVPEPKALVEGLIYQDSLHMIFGKPSAGKSIFSQRLAVACAEGEPTFLGLPSTLSGPVLYLDFEAAHSTQERLRALGSPTDVVVPRRAALDGLCLNRPGDVDRLVRAAKRWHDQYALVIVDTLQPATDGDLSSAGNASESMNGIKRLMRLLRAAGLAIHHTPHSEAHRASGSVSIPAALDRSYRVAQTKRKVKVTCKKSRVGTPDDLTPPINFRITDGWQLEAIGNEPELEPKAEPEPEVDPKDVYLQLRAEGLSQREAAEKAGVARSTAQHWEPKSA